MTQKLKVLLVAISTLLLSTPFAKASIQKFPYVRSIWLQDIIIVYLEEVENGEDIRMCFLSQAWLHKGKSVTELFALACSDKEESIKLVAAFLNTRRWQWIFFYMEGEVDDQKTVTNREVGE